MNDDYEPDEHFPACFDRHGRCLAAKEELASPSRDQVERLCKAMNAEDPNDFSQWDVMTKWRLKTRQKEENAT